MIDREVYTPSGVKISLLQVKAQKAKCKLKKTLVKSFADSAYFICFLSLLEFRLVQPKSTLVPHVLENIKSRTKKKTVLIVILFFLYTRAMIYHTQAFITQHNV